MSTVDAEPSRSRSIRYDLTVTRGDRTASVLIALVVFITVVIVGLFILWLTNRIFQKTPLQAIQIARARGGKADAFGQNQDLQPPGVEEIPQLSPPTLEQTLQKVVDGVGRVSAELDNPNLQGEGVAGGGGLGGSGNDIGKGDGGDVDAIPIWERWQIDINPGSTLNGYAKLLDSFGIELGIIGGSPNITYVNNLSNPMPTVTVRPRSVEDHRVYFSWDSGDLQRADRSLLRRAGITVKPRQIILHWYPTAKDPNTDPPQLVERLELMEQNLYTERGKTLSDVRKTIFGIRRAKTGKHEFYIIDQLYRAQP